MSVLDKLNKLVESKKNTNKNRKCPACGQPIEVISVKCPLCGYTFRYQDIEKGAVQELVNEINKLEKSRGIITDSVRAKISGRNIYPTDEKIANLIKNFVVPNTKEDIFQFMFLASSNMDSWVLAGQETEGVSELVVKAWENKFEQTYQKAKMLFYEDNDFKLIQEIYDAKRSDIEEKKINLAKSKGFFRRLKR